MLKKTLFFKNKFFFSNVFVTPEKYKQINKKKISITQTPTLIVQDFDQLNNDRKLNVFLSEALKNKKFIINHDNNKLNTQSHRKIVLSFKQILASNNIEFSTIAKFLEYIEKFNLLNEININLLATDFLNYRNNKLNDVNYLPQIFNFFHRHELNNDILINMLDKICLVMNSDEKIDENILMNILVIIFEFNQQDKHKEFITKIINKLLIGGLDNFDKSDYIVFSKLYNYPNCFKIKSLFSFIQIYEVELSKRLEYFNRYEISQLVKNFQNYENLSEELIYAFEKTIHDLKNELSDSNLKLFFDFLRKLIKKKNTKYLYNLLMEMNKRKFISFSQDMDYELNLMWENNHELIEKIYTISGDQTENDYIYKYSFFHKKFIDSYKHNNIKYEKKIKLIQEVAELIEKIKDFKKLTALLKLCNKLSIKQLDILHSLYLRISEGLNNNKIKLENIINIIYCFLDNSYLIDFSSYLNNYETCLDIDLKYLSISNLVSLIKICCIYNLHNFGKNNFLEIISNFIFSNKINFSYNERIELLNFLTFSKKTCNVQLINYLLNSYSETNNKNIDYQNEKKNIIKDKKIGKILNKIKVFCPDFIFNEEINTLYENWLNDLHNETKPFFYLSTLEENIKNKIKEIILESKKQIQIKENQVINGFEIDLIINSENKKSLLIEINGRFHFYLNERKLNYNTEAKNEFFKELKQFNLAQIQYYEWNDSKKKEDFLLEIIKKYIDL